MQKTKDKSKKKKVRPLQYIFNIFFKRYHKSEAFDLVIFNIVLIYYFFLKQIKNMF